MAKDYLKMIRRLLDEEDVVRKQREKQLDEERKQREKQFAEELAKKEKQLAEEQAKKEKQLDEERKQREKQYAEEQAKKEKLFAMKLALREKQFAEELAVKEKQLAQQEAENMQLKDVQQNMEQQISYWRNKYFMSAEHAELLSVSKENEDYKRGEKMFEKKINKLQTNLGDETVPLSVLAEGLKDYAEEAGIGRAHDLFNQLNTLLISVTAWTENVPQLKRFFRDFNKKLAERAVTMTGEHATYMEIK